MTASLGILSLLLILLIQTFVLSENRFVCFKAHSSGKCSMKLKLTKTSADGCCRRSNVVAYHTSVVPLQVNGKPLKVNGKRVFKCTPCDPNTTVAINGQWEEWSDWQQCSVSCGSGVQSRKRLCINPPPSGGGQACSNVTDIEREEKNCTEGICPVNGEWGTWGCWSSCTTTCGSGSQHRERSCDNPAPQHNGQECRGPSSEDQKCNKHICPEHGNWGSWFPWFSCTHTCGGGKQYRVRQCNNPSPRYGGIFCPGIDRHDQQCNTHHCPVDGEWGAWSAYTRCSVTCGKGSKTSSRQCLGRQHGGAACEGVSSRSRDCNIRACPINGHWSAWSDWSMCSVTCESGRRSRTRTCDNPYPEHGGRDCAGNPKDKEVCDTGVAHCPIHGVWSNWTPWRSCSAKRCSPRPGYRVRVHYCNNPQPQYNGRKCPGPQAERIQCTNTKGCRVDGQWCSWSNWGTCTRGKQIRIRQCECPVPKNGGSICRNDRRAPVMTMTDKPQSCIVGEVTGSGCGGSGAGSSGDGAAGDDEECGQGSGGSGSGNGAD